MVSELSPAHPKDSPDQAGTPGLGLSPRDTRLFNLKVSPSDNLPSVHSATSDPRHCAPAIFALAQKIEAQEIARDTELEQMLDQWIEASVNALNSTQVPSRPTLSALNMRSAKFLTQVASSRLKFARRKSQPQLAATPQNTFQQQRLRLSYGAVKERILESAGRQDGRLNLSFIEVFDMLGRMLGGSLWDWRPTLKANIYRAVHSDRRNQAITNWQLVKQALDTLPKEVLEQAGADQWVYVSLEGQDLERLPAWVCLENFPNLKSINLANNQFDQAEQKRIQKLLDNQVSVFFSNPLLNRISITEDDLEI